MTSYADVLALYNRRVWGEEARRRESDPTLINIRAAAAIAAERADVHYDGAFAAGNYATGTRRER